MATTTFLQSPDQLFGPLFHDVQTSPVFSDSKTFVDCIPKQAPADLVALYEAQKTTPGFDLGTFVHAHFIAPERVASDYVSDTSVSTTEHINNLWERLTRPGDALSADAAGSEGLVHGGSRISLPHPYVVPGGRFREVFYWDSYFTMLGLQEAGHTNLIRGMLDNFAYLIDHFGFIPNGNRTYFLTRSQPPYFALMVRLLADTDGPDTLVKYLPQLQREYDFWMTGTDQLSPDNPAVRHVIQLPDGNILNRYWDDTPTPRPESYRQEIDLTPEADKLGIPLETLYEHIRAACESGWDFSSRWFADAHTLVTIRTADIIPVDLNCLLYELEQTLSEAYGVAGKSTEKDQFSQRAENRLRQVQQLFWSDKSGFFNDYDRLTRQPLPVQTLAGALTLMTGIATPEQARRMHDRLRTDFLQVGGWVTTLNNTSQQWDWPNGWAPLQWIVYQGLLTYGFADTARDGRDRWLDHNDKVFKATGKMMEKYNVVDAAITTGGGEYPNQDGFGWTNGVYLRMMADKTKEVEPTG